jgi:integrase
MQRGSLKVVKNRKGVKVWRAQWRDDGHGRTRILGRYCDMTLAVARAELAKILAPLKTLALAAATAPAAVTLRSFVEDDYLAVKTRVWKESSTRVTTEQIIRTHVLADFGHRALPSISRKELQVHLDHKAAAGLSYSVVAHIRWQLVAIFNMAASDGLIMVNPTGGLVTPRCQSAIDKRTISRDDIHRAQMVLELRERLIFRLAVCEGMRPGEIVGLQTGDWRDGFLHVERRIYRGKLDVPKSRRSRRPIPPTETTRLLLEQWLELSGNRLQEEWLFPSESGVTPVSASNVFRRRIRPALKSIGLGAVNFQVLRRTWVTEFSEVERDPKIRAQLAGHSVDVHENEYRQVQPGALKRAMGRLGKRLQ